MTLIFDNIRKGLSRDVIYVADLSDLPGPVGNVITLSAGKSYLLRRSLDLQGNRLVIPNETSLKGETYFNTVLSSTGLPSGESVVTSSAGIFITNLDIAAPSNCIGLTIDGSGIRSASIDRVNFTGAGKAGDFNNITNLFLQNVGITTSSDGITLSGTFDTVAVSDTLISGAGAGYRGLFFDSTFQCSRRVRILYTALIAVSGASSIFIDPSATFPIEGLILIGVNAAGGGTYINGISAQDNRLLVINSRGIAESFSAAEYYMSGNATSTPIAVANTFTKVLGTTLAGATLSKFTLANNRATYNGALSGLFLVHVRTSFSGPNNNIAAFRVAKNGVTIAASDAARAATGATTLVSVGTNTLVQLTAGDFIEVFVTNRTGPNAITVADLGVVITAIR